MAEDESDVFKGVKWKVDVLNHTSALARGLGDYQHGQPV
jgi:hypothetical protein